jgi:iron complex transport system permease protein
MIWRLTLLSLVVVACGLISLAIGQVQLAPGTVLASLWNGGEGGTAADNIVWQLRFPRVLLAICLGAGLGCAGAGYQGLFRNALADPFVIGASSGAALGATLALALGWKGVSWWGLSGVSLSALAGTLLVVALVYAMATFGRDTPTLALLLAGVAVSSFVGAVVSIVMFLQSEQLAAIFGWLMGSLSRSDWPTLTAAVPLIGAGMLGLWVLSRSLDCLSFGDESASSLGFDLRWIRAAIVIAASVATAAAVAAAGIIGFVGLIAPHMARLLMSTSRHAVVLPASCLAGGLLLLAADDAARTLVANEELPVGVITALLGGPFFLYLLRRRRTLMERRA